ERGLEFAKTKPAAVKAYMAKLSEPRFGIDVLKVEVPVNMAFVQGARANTSGQVAQTKAEALRQFKEAADAATKPFIYLSAGVSDDVFRESLEWAGEAAARPSGVLCGRAPGLEGLPVYAKQGRAAFDAWLHAEGVRTIPMLDAVLHRSREPRRTAT